MSKPKIRALPTLADVRAAGGPVPKPLPHAITKANKAKEKKSKEVAFREAVWARDKGRSRASGRQLLRSSSNYKDLGDVHHVLARSTDPDKIYLSSNGLLLSREEHILAETMCPGDPEHCYLSIDGPLDRAQPQVFVWRDTQGRVLKTRVG